MDMYSDIFEIISDKYSININRDWSEEGTYGRVFRAVSKYPDKQSGNYVIKFFLDEYHDANIINEIDCLKKLSKYPMFPKFIAFDIIYNKKLKKDHNILIMSYCGNTINKTNLNKQNRLYLALQFLKAYRILEKNGIIHRDIKGNNVCVDHDGKLSIIDFGYVRQVPLVSSYMKVIIDNMHTESMLDRYPVEYSHLVDLLSIYNMLIYIFCKDIVAKFGYHVYPINVSNIGDQLENIIFLILNHKNNETIRTRIHKFLSKNLELLVLPIDAFHEYFNEKKEIHKKYKLLYSLIPVKMIRCMKKLLNINPKTRITYHQFYRLVKRSFFNSDKVPRELNINYTKSEIMSFDYYTNLLNPFEIAPPVKKYIPIELYAMIYYNYHRVLPEFSINEREKLKTVIYFICYSTIMNNSEPDWLHIEIDKNIYLKYLSLIQSGFNIGNPFLYIKKMKFLKWNSKQLSLFSYFLIQVSINIQYIKLDPYILCLMISLFIYFLPYRTRFNDLINKEEDIRLNYPSNIGDKICTIDYSKIMEMLINKNFVKYFGKFTEYIQKMNVQNLLKYINKFCKEKFPLLSNFINEYTKISRKMEAELNIDNKKQKITLSEELS